MKNKKIVLTSIATVLSLGILAGSFALFTEKDSDINVSIGGTIGSNGNLVLSEKSVDKDKILGLSKDVNVQNKLHFAYNLSLNNNNSKVYTQDTTIGKIRLVINVDETIKSSITADAQILGYEAGSYGEHTYKTLNANTSTSGKIIFENTIAFKTTATQYIDFNIGLNSNVKDYASFSNLAGKSISYDLTLTDDKAFTYAYLAGDMENSLWEENAYYKMYPAIDFKYSDADSTKGFRWRWFGELGESHIKGRIKNINNVQIGDNTPEDLWSKDNIATSAGSKEYLWTGVHTDNIYTI